MTKILTVARSEYLRAVATKAFIIGVILMPVLFGGGIIALAIAEKTADTEDRHFAVIDRSGLSTERDAGGNDGVAVRPPDLSRGFRMQPIGNAGEHRPLRNAPPRAAIRLGNHFHHTHELRQ